MPSVQSDMFKKTFKIYKIFGVWPGQTPIKFYKYYSFVYLFVTLACYNLLLTLNLIYTPWKIELLLREMIFYFTEIKNAMKALTILFMRDKLMHTLNLIDCDEFVGDYENKDGILYKINRSFRLFWNFYVHIANAAYLSIAVVPVLLYMLRGTKVELPICNYYFLSDEVRESYFLFWYMYQTLGIYGHMMYDVNTDLLIAGLLLIAVTQLKLLNKNLTNFKLSEEECKLPIEIQDKMQITRLKNFLRHYEVILNYCETVEDIFSVALFFQFGIAAIVICVAMCGLLSAPSTEVVAFLVVYVFIITAQIFMSGFLGTQLEYESQELVTSAYNSQWIPRSESYKRRLKLFIERAQTPITISGLKIIPVTLVTFVSIMKTAYSFFTLVRSVQEE